MKKNKITPYILLLFCSLIACTILDVVRDFNQDLSLWDVSSVIECTAFAKVSGNSYDIESWTLPKPNFTNCIPGQIQTD